MLTFSWLAHNRSLALIEHITPSARGFSVVQPSELENAEEFIQSDSLVLTLGIAFRERPEELGRYIDHLIDAGAVAIGFGTGVPFATVPEIVMDTARRRGIGLYEVPQHIPFISIVTAAHQERQRLAHLEQQKLMDAQQRLTASATTGSLDSLLKEAAELLQARVSIVGSAGSLAGNASALSSPASEKLHYSSYKMPARSGRHHVLEIRSASRLTTAQRTLVRHCAGLADVLLARPHELRAARNELNSFALAVRLGLTKEGELLPSAFDSPTDDKGLTRPIILVTDNSSALRLALSSLDHSAEEVGRFLFSVLLPDHAALVLALPNQPVEEILTELGSAARRVRVAIGRPVAHPDETYVAALRSRAELLALGEHALPDSIQLPWLHEPTVVQALIARKQELFGRLELEDKHSGTSYARTLTVYLKQGGKLEDTAQALGIHRHTVRNRIAKIQQICQIDLSEPSTFAEAYFSSAVDDPGATARR